MFKTLILQIGIAVLAASVFAWASDRRGFEELAARAAIADQASAHGTNCPLSAASTDTADLKMLSICLKYGLEAYDAAQRYPATAEKVFAVFGEDEAFQNVFHRYGHPVIPIIAFFVENGSRAVQIRQTVSDVSQQIWEGHAPKWALAEISPEQNGLIAIDSLAKRGNEMLSEFEIVDGKAKRKPVTQFFLGVKDFFIGDVADIETILVRGERLPSWKEAGLAALDVTIVAGAVGAVTKVARFGVGTAETVEKNSLRLAEDASAGKSRIRLAAEGAYGAINAVRRAGVLIAPAAFVYIAITRPYLIASAGGWVAEQLGGNRWVGIFAVYLIGIFAILRLLPPLLWCGRLIGKSALRLVRVQGGFLTQR